jgi:hypothetical protein
LGYRWHAVGLSKHAKCREERRRKGNEWNEVNADKDDGYDDLIMSSLELAARKVYRKRL